MRWVGILCIAAVGCADAARERDDVIGGRLERDRTLSGNVTIEDDLGPASIGLFGNSYLVADLRFNNWYGHDDADVELALVQDANFSGGWFEQAPPRGPGVTAFALSATRLDDTGPRL